jgi:hydroxymethylpyrimidine pyrophosphatase-like HAD family hydrolase
MSYFKAVAVDYDGTLTQGARPAPELLATVEEARSRGLKLLLVTGRILSELRRDFSDVDDAFDLIVAENGAVVSGPLGTRRLAHHRVPSTLGEELMRRNIPVRWGEVLLTCDAVHEVAVLEAIRRLGLGCQLVRNRDALMVIPAGVTKGSGVVTGLADLGISPHSALAIGDAENDYALFEACELGVAVANAVDALKRCADIVLTEPDGAGVARLLGGSLLHGKEWVYPKRWQVKMGMLTNGTPAYIPASQINVLISGDSRTGKSRAAGLFAEQLIRMGYSLLVVDPEGDYASLGQLPGVVTVGRGNDVPPPERLAHLIQHHFGTVVLDLSLLSWNEKNAYFRTAPPHVEAQRASTGLPHWIIVDEAHYPLGGQGVAREFFNPSAKGYCLVTYRPRQLCQEARGNIDALLAFSGDIDAESLANCAELSEERFRKALSLVQPGQAVLAMRARPREARLVTIGKRMTPHVRHRHKYAEVQLPPWLRFYFRRSVEQATGAVAGNIEEFYREVRGCNVDVIYHHTCRCDFSRWIAHTIQDELLALQVRTIEESPYAESESALDTLRHDILAAIKNRYLG